jgi:hypothetical protein
MKLRLVRKENGFFLVFALMMAIFLTGGCSSDSGGGPMIASDISSIDFGNQVIGNSTEREVILANTGTANLEINAITEPEGFTVSRACPSSTLAPRESCTMLVRFTPAEQKVYNGSFTIDSTAGNLPITVAGSGKGLIVGINNLTPNCADSTVKVNVNVSRHDNSPVSDLVENNFTIYLDKKRFYPSSWSAINVLEPASVALALDWSNSFREFRWEIQQKSKELINLLDDDDRAAVYKFALDIDEAAQPYINVGTGRETLAKAIDSNFIGEPKPTILWDAVHYIVEETASEPNEKRAVILLTDGWDDGSAVSLQDLIQYARDNNVVVFTIGLGTINSGAMEKLAHETGGIHFNALSMDSLMDSLMDIYQKIAHLLTNQYELIFTNHSPATAKLLEVVVVDGVLEGVGARKVPECK